MEKLKFLLRSTITNLFSIFLFYCIAAIVGGFETFKLSFARVVLMVMFAFAIPLINIICDSLGFSKAPKIIVNFSTVLALFMLVFFISGETNLNRTAAVVALILIFTFAYWLVRLCSSLFDRLFIKASISLAKKAQRKEAKETNRYKPIYSDHKNEND